MTNEELKKKIVDVLQGNVEYELHYFPDDNYTEVEFDYDKLADALIANGYGNVADWKRKAEIAEKKFELLYTEANNSIILPKKEKYIQQAEKELAEEGNMTDEEKIKLENKIAFLENTVTIMQQRLKSLGKKYSEDLEKVNGELLKILQLQKENDELRARLDKAVELPCKVEDNIYVRYYNNKKKRHYLEIEKVSKTNFNITNGFLSGTVYTYDFSKRYEGDNCYNMRDYNKKWFTDPNKAKTHLTELKRSMRNETN